MVAMNKEKFREKLDDVLGLNNHIIKAAEELYDSSLPYHNFDHVLETIANSEIIIKNCEDEKITVDKKVVYYALLFHDAGYQENHLEKGFETKERYSAHLAHIALERIGESEKMVESVSKAILATQKNATFSTIEEKIVRASDLTGLADDYDTFRSNNEKLRQEVEILTGKKLSMDEWKNQTKDIVEFYLRQDIRLTSAHNNREGESVFHKATKRNLKKFLNDEDNYPKSLDLQRKLKHSPKGKCLDFGVLNGHQISDNLSDNPFLDLWANKE